MLPAPAPEPRLGTARWVPPCAPRPVRGARLGWARLGSARGCPVPCWAALHRPRSRCTGRCLRAPSVARTGLGARPGARRAGPAPRCARVCPVPGGFGELGPEVGAPGADPALPGSDRPAPVSAAACPGTSLPRSGRAGARGQGCPWRVPAPAAPRAPGPEPPGLGGAPGQPVGGVPAAGGVRAPGTTAGRCGGGSAVLRGPGSCCSVV